ncbi:hypothetical protein [uncultured Pseudomonas sp.]|uniref:hypothetical protein n=1 Tax=uncultured Pseudomonas sp. TaxID=114707 RepID=UPI0025D77B10|nr:hypothetical protein [uncultured Pseudomonas sp.]
MSTKLLCFMLCATLLGGCATSKEVSPGATALASDTSRLVGIWAMQPLNNGIANVSEFRADGTVLLHPFNCLDSHVQAPEPGRYSIAADGSRIQVQAPQERFELKVLAFSPQTMQLGMEVAGQSLTFDYRKVTQLAPRCEGYPSAAERARQTPYQPSDFTPAPQVPAHANLQRYLGKWALDGEVQVEIRRDARGVTVIDHATGGDWHYLYNDVRWVGNALHFQSFAYSANPAQFSHPLHKSQSATILQPTADGRMRYIQMINGELAEQLLSRVR